MILGQNWFLCEKLRQFFFSYPKCTLKFISYPKCTLVRFIHSQHSHSPARLSKFKKILARLSKFKTILARRPKSVPTPGLDQMLTVMSLSQHRVSSSKTVRPRAPCGARCIGHAVSTWSAVCSEVPHSQFGEGARPHLCMDEWNRPTPVRRRLSLTQAARGKPIPTGLAPVSGTKARSLEAFSQYSVFHL